MYFQEICVTLPIIRHVTLLPGKGINPLALAQVASR
jgi:hypothetical protein